MKPFENHYFECSCSNDEHMIKFTYDPSEPSEVYLSTFLRHYRPWWKRIWVAVKYVFGYKCQYGHFDCTILESEDIMRLRDMLCSVTGTVQIETSTDTDRLAFCFGNPDSGATSAQIEEIMMHTSTLGEARTMIDGFIDAARAAPRKKTNA